MLLTMAARNLRRNKRRTAITLFSVAFGVWLSTTFTGAGDYSYSNMINTGVRMGFGHLTIQPKGYQQTPGLDLRVEGAEQLGAELAKVKGVSSATPRITGQGMFATASKSVGGAFFAVDPRRERPEINVFVKALKFGKMFEHDDKRGVVVGSVMAEKLGLKLGKRLVYTMVDVHGEIVSDAARVRGIFSTGVEDVDGSMVLLPIASVRRLLKYKPGAATLVSVVLDDHREVPAIQTALKTKVSGAQVLTWRQTQEELAAMIEMDRAMNYLFQVLVGLLIAAGVLNTMLMSVLERKREFGVMMALGTRPGQLFRLVVIEAFIIGVAGLVLGALLTAPWYIYLNQVGIDLSSMMGEDVHAAGVLIEPVMRLFLYPKSVVSILMGVLTLTMIAGLYPAWQAGRDPPVETLKNI